jgi:starvation-inducible DNA-binding protein
MEEALMNDLTERRKAPLKSPTDLGLNVTRDVSGALNALLADVFALYLKTKNFHWHVSGPHFRDYHLMFDEQADQIFAITDDIAERVRKIGGTTLHSIGEICSVFPTMMPTMSIPATCSPNSVRTIRR